MTGALPAQLSRWRAAAHLVIFGAIFILAVFLSYLLAPIPPDQGRQLSPQVMLLAEGQLLAGVLIATAIMAAIERRGIWCYGLKDSRAFPRFMAGVVSGIVLNSILIGGIAALGCLAVTPALTRPFDVLTYACVWATVFFLVALGEEMLFRGYLQTALARLIGFWPAAVILSAAFGLVHLSNPQTTPLCIAAAAALGMILSVCLRLSGSLWWGIGFHAAWDWAQSFLYGAAAYGPYLEGRLLHAAPIGDPQWSGGVVGPEGSGLIMPVLVLTAFVVWLSFRPVTRRAALE